MTETSLTPAQEKVSKKLVEILSKYMSTVHMFAVSKMGIGRNFSEREQLCFLGYIAAFCYAFGYKYGEEINSSFSGSLFLGVRQALYKDDNDRNPLEDIQGNLEIREFRAGFDVGCEEGEAFAKGETEKGGLPGFKFIRVLENL